MASKNQVAGKTKTKDKTPKNTQGSLSNKEKKDLAQKIQNLQDENQKLRLENVMFKNKFDLREIIKVLTQKGVTEVDGIEISKDMVKTALQEADEKHSAEKKYMEKKHEKEIEKLSQKLQGADEQQTQSKLTTADELLSKKDNEITDLRKQLANLTTRNQDAISKTVKSDDMDVQLRETTKEKEKAISEKNALLAEKQNLEAKIQKLQNEIQEQKNSYENENKDLLAKKQKLEAEIQKLTNENNEQKNSYEKTKDLMEKEKGALLADKQKWDAEIKRLQDEIKALKQSEENNKSLNEKLKKVEEAKDNLSQQVQALQKENNELKYRLKESQSPPLSNVISANDNKTVQQLRVENERLLSRLSELAGAQMTHNNPNIADLSDGFRPTKLSEEYSQLYDNLWTDAFEEHSGKKEEDVIQMLRKGLLSSYKFCENVCSEFTIQLTNSSLALPNSKPKKGDIPIVYKKQLQDMKKSFGVFLRNDVKESYRKQNTIEGGDKTKNYIDTCVELCWLMVIQDPPVVIETLASKDSAFDTNTYRAYTTTGTKVDFVVWPALRLHQGGPLLAKGVAQGKN